MIKLSQNQNLTLCSFFVHNKLLKSNQIIKSDLLLLHEYLSKISQQKYNFKVKLNNDWIFIFGHIIPAYNNLCTLSTHNYGANHSLWVDKVRGLTTKIHHPNRSNPPVLIYSL